MFRLRDWFFTTTESATKRGSRFKNGDRPPEATFFDLITSIVFKTEPDDRAKEDAATVPVAELNGHVVAATDVQARANEDKKTDRTLVVQPRQLPTVTTDGLMTISSPNVPFAEDAGIVVSISPETKRNVFITNLTSGLTNWFQSLTSFVDNFYATFVSHIADYDITKGQVIQNTADIVALSPGGSPAVVPIGGVMQWMADVGLPATFHALEGGELEQATNPLLFAVLGTKYNNGSETPGYFRLPDMRGRVARGVYAGGPPIEGSAQVIGANHGSDTILLNHNNIPAHNHDGSGLTLSGDGAHGHTWTGNTPTRGTWKYEVGSDGNDNGHAVNFPNTTDIDSSSGGHSHTISGNTGFNSTTNAPVEILPQVTLVVYIMKGE